MAIAAALGMATCGGASQTGVDAAAPDAAVPDAAAPAVRLAARVEARRFLVADHMLASIEMQISGEPFAELIGRDLAGYDRFSATTDLYADPGGGGPKPDPLGYSLAVEIYEYSKQAMNNLSFESGAGMSLQHGLLLNPTGQTGLPAYVQLRDRLQLFAAQSGSGGPVGTNFVVSPAPSDNPLNYYGWPGIWPVFAEYRSFDPSIRPSEGATNGCTLEGGYAAMAAGQQRVGDYECGYSTLNLPVREAQIDPVLEPAALGLAGWKQALWVINYWQALHDPMGNLITEVADAEVAAIGQPGNQVVGRYPDPSDPTGEKLIDGEPGVMLGASALEGFQGLVMIEELDNKSELLLRRLLAPPGSRLVSGFASTKQAIDYDHEAPVRYWPAEVAVTEAATSPTGELAKKFFPRPTRYDLKRQTSRVRDLVALLGGYGAFFSFTDKRNREVGGSASSRATFDGDPFRADTDVAGEETPHDRALAVLKVALVNLDRLHFDAKAGALVDEVDLSAAAPKAGTRAGTVDAAYAIVGLRTARRALDATLTLYSNDTPDTLGLAGALDGTAWRGAPGGATIGGRLSALIKAEADLIADRILDAQGVAANGWDVAAGRDPAPLEVEAQAAAVRGLLEAYLATSDERYRARATQAYAQLVRLFWMDDARIFRTTAGQDDKLVYTPIRVATLEGALRQYWKLVASRPGSEVAAKALLGRVQRLNKLVINGWDDADGDDVVDLPGECTGASMQLGERALTGELSHPEDGPDRDRDCVREIAAAGVPAALAGAVVIERR